MVLPDPVADELPEPLAVPAVPEAVDDDVVSLLVPLWELDAPDVGEVVDDEPEGLLLGVVDFGWVWLEEELDCA